MSPQIPFVGTKHSWSPQNNCFVPPNSVYKHKTCKQCVDVVLKTQMMVAWRNGEDIYHCDSVVDEALDIYLSKCKREGDREGHFIRQSFVDSKAKCPAKLPVMCNDK